MRATLGVSLAYPAPKCLISCRRSPWMISSLSIISSSFSITTSEAGGGGGGGGGGSVSSAIWKVRNSGPM